MCADKYVRSCVRDLHLTHFSPYSSLNKRQHMFTVLLLLLLTSTLSEHQPHFDLSFFSLSSAPSRSSCAFQQLWVQQPPAPAPPGGPAHGAGAQGGPVLQRWGNRRPVGGRGCGPERAALTESEGVGGKSKHYNIHISSCPLQGKIKRGEILEMGVCFGCGESNTENQECSFLNIYDRRKWNECEPTHRYSTI